jgi:hypothetical protein
MSRELGLRQAYQTIKNAYASKGRSPVTTASDLRLIVPVSSSKTSYTFPVLVGDDANNYAEAILLNRADAFTAINMALYVGKKASATDYAYDWFSYGNITEFGSTDGDALKVLFNNSTLSATINNVQYLQNFSTMRFKQIGITQNGQTNWSSATYTNQESLNNEQGFIPVVPTLQLSGTSKIELTLNLPSALSTSGVGSGSYVIALHLRGFLSLGASNLNK